MGRTVISTIHQPSREIFLMFDDLLLLQRGGWQVYFGPLGPSPASTFVAYMESLECTRGKKLPAGMNPASWMLDVLGGTDSSQTEERSDKAKASAELLDGAELERLFKASAAGGAASSLVDKVAIPTPGEKMYSFASPYARSLGTQLRTILVRLTEALATGGCVPSRLLVLYILGIVASTWTRATRAACSRWSRWCS